MAKKAKNADAVKLVQLYAMLGERQYLVAKLNGEITAYLQQVDQIKEAQKAAGQGK